MAEITPRILFSNLIQLSNTVITPMSEDSTLNFSLGLRDQIPSRVGRSALGWEIVTGYNDKLDITEATTGDATATLTAGTYSTPTLMAAELETQINVAATDNTYTVTYSSTTNKFTIARATGTDAFGLEWSTGTNSATSIGIDIGFTVSADDTGAVTYAADNASVMSRFYIKFDLASALGVTSIAIYGHNFTNAAVVRLQGNATDTWTSPTYNQLLTWNADKIVLFLTQQTFRYWRIYVEDLENTNGFVEMSVIYLGTYTQPSRSYQQRFSEPRQELSQIAVADHGAHYYTDKPSRQGFSGDFLRLSETDRTNLESWLNHVKQGRNFFFALDPLNEPNDRTFYGSIAPTAFRHAGGGTVLRWNLPVTFAEALG